MSSFDPTTAVVTLAGVLLAIAIRRARAFIAEWFTKAVDWVLWHAGRRVKRSFARRLSIKRYCALELDAESSKTLELPGAFSKTLETDKAFIPLLLDEGRGADVSFSHTTLLQSGQRIRIVGDPGSGKSSLTKRLFRDACEEALRDPVSARLPIRIELKSFIPPEDLSEAKDLADWALDRLRATVIEANAFDMEACFDSYLSDAGLLVLLDGLDEVPASAYPRTAEAIRCLSRRLERLTEKTVVVMTMRSQFHVQVADDFTGAFPRVLHIRPLTTNDIFLFLTRWPYDEGVDVAATVNRVYGDLTDRPTLREMCTNPLVLAMYVATDERAEDASELPETRAQFYSHVVRELLIVRRSRQVGVAAARTAVRREREAILGRLAFEHLTNPDEPANAVPWAHALTIAGDVLGHDDTDELERYLRSLANETGLFTEERIGETIRFIHLTFCEFFAALEAVNGRSGGWEQIRDQHREFLASERRQLRSRLVEVVPFAVGLLQPNRVEAGLAEVAGLGQPDVFVRCVLETQLYGHPAWTQFAQTELRDLTTSTPDRWDEQWLARLQLFGVALREGERWAELTGRQAAVRSEDLYEGLIGSDEQRLVRLFASFASQDAAASFRLAETCGVDLLASRPDLLVEACAEPPFLALAIERAEREPEQTRWISVLAEATLRFEAVAAALDRRPPVEAWRQKVARLPRRRRWPRDLSSDAPDFAGVVRTLAIDREVGATGLTAFPFVRLLSFLPSAGTGPKWRYAVAGSAALLVSGFVASLSLRFNEADTSSESVARNLSTLAIGMLGYLGFFAAQFAYGRRRHMYRYLLNMARFESTEIHARDERAVRGPRPTRVERLLMRRQVCVLHLLVVMRTLIGLPGTDMVVYAVEHIAGADERYCVTRVGEWTLECQPKGDMTARGGAHHQGGAALGESAESIVTASLP